MTALTLLARPQNWRLNKPFKIARGTKNEAETVIVTLSDGQYSGIGECTPYPRYNETVESVLRQLSSVAREPESFETLEAIQEALPAGAARNALDCAFHDLVAKSSGITVAHKLGLTMKPVETAYTISLDTPEAMNAAAKAANQRPILKVKLGGGTADHERMHAVREAAPNSRLIVDANESWNAATLEDDIAVANACNVSLIEQPLTADDDAALMEISSSVPICADESIHTTADLEIIAARYQAVNIKLDKTGGLTEAVLLLNEAKSRGLSVMVGCMVASSLAMAPALLLAQKADWVDLDGPLLLAEDYPTPLRIEGSVIYPPARDLWG